MDEDRDQDYFHAVEEIFLTLRGSPLTLGPADWHVARRWHREGIPLEVVRESLEEVFARRRERGTRGKISSLRYCASAVEDAWAELRDLTAPGVRTAAAPLDTALRLAALAAALPADLPDREALASRLTALTGEPQEIEEHLAALDREVLAAAGAALDAAGRGELEAAAEKTLAALAGRLPAAELDRSRERLAGQLLRRKLGMPVLSLFSPEAEVAAPPAE